MKNQQLFSGVLLAIILGACSGSDDPTPAGPIEITASNQQFEVDENPLAGAVLGTVAATASDGALTYSIVSQSPQDAVALDATTAQLTVNDETIFDYEAVQEIEVTVEIQAEDEESATVVVTIDINNVAESLNIGFSNSTIDENSLNGTTVATVTSSTDAGEVQYSLIDGATDIFEINSSGEILVKDGALLDYEALSGEGSTTLSVTIKGTNSLNSDVSSTGAMSITVNDITGTNEISERLSEGQTLLQAYQAKNSNLDLIIGYDYEGGLIGQFNTTNGTGLIVVALALQRTFSQAQSFVNVSNINGYTDWRLMTQNEALAMCEYEDKLYQSTVWSWFWTSTPAMFGHYAYVFGSTADGSCSESAPQDSNELFIRAVREF